MAAIGLLAPATSILATPYACDITNSAGIVSFRQRKSDFQCRGGDQ